MDRTKFSTRLEAWLKGDKPKTLQTLLDTFKEKGFAVLFLLLMSVPALPLPTGGVTHIFEIVTMLLSLELIIGRRDVWLPAKWRSMSLTSNYQIKTVGTLFKVIQFAERFSKPRFRGLLSNQSTLRPIGLLTLVLTVIAFIAPPFSGLDTLPALGIVFISLAMILDDILLAIVGFVIGLAGAVLVITLGRIIFNLL